MVDCTSLIQNPPAPLCPPTPASVRKLLSLRELARGERMSRHKLNRLLTAVDIRPVAVRRASPIGTRPAGRCAIA